MINLPIDISNVRNSIDKATNLQNHLLKAVDHKSNNQEDNVKIHN